MSRIIQLRVRGVGAGEISGLRTRFAHLVGGREWRGGTPWLADAGSADLLPQLFFGRAHAEARAAGDDRPLNAAAFVRIAGDEADALAMAFIAREVSERFSVDVDLRDPDNPISKLRNVELCNGVLRNGVPLESILVRRVIYRRMADGSRMEMIPPQAQGSLFGAPFNDDPGRFWSFIVHDIRVTEPTFLDAEAEAMRIFRGLRALSSDDRG